MFKQEKGITLVALVITIIVLLILAGVSISLVVGDNGVLTKATQSASETNRASALDILNTAVSSCQATVTDEVAASGSVNFVQSCFDVYITEEGTISSSTPDMSLLETELSNQSYEIVGSSTADVVNGKVVISLVIQKEGNSKTANQVAFTITENGIGAKVAYK